LISCSGPGGDGVNNALHDSVELARQIIKHGIDDLESAVVEYEEAMFPRAVEAINKGQWAAEHLFSAESSQSFLQAVMQQ
jgi:2-polyprenyl-6-methoxyphenol hydroxylase-like FAD-dependent oxidoreductase